jgi:hypothetical protein
MQVPVQHVRREIAELKRAHCIDYMTKAKCKEVAGWSWGQMKYKWSSSTGPMYEIRFYTPEAETYYRLKWTDEWRA